VLKTGVVDEEKAKKESTMRRASINFLLGPEESEEWISASHRITARHGEIEGQAYCVADRRGG